MGGPLRAVVDIVHDEGAVAKGVAAAIGLALFNADRRVYSWRQPTMTGGDKSTRLWRQHDLWRQRAKTVCSLMRVGPQELLTGVSEVELVPRLTSLVAAQTFSVTRVSRQAKTPGPTSCHVLVHTLEEDIPRQPGTTC